MTREPTAPAALVRDPTLDKLRALHRLTAALYEAGSPAEFYEQVVDAVVQVVGADRASLLLFDDDDVMRFKAWRGLSDAYRTAVEGHTPWSPGDVDATPILVPDVDDDPDLATFNPLFKAEGIGALAFIPLLHRGGVVGKFMLYYNQPHRFEAQELAVTEILAAQVALAVQRRQVEQAARDSEQRFRRLIATSTEAFVAVDCDGAITEWNQQAEATFGWARAEAIGRTLLDTIIPARYRDAHAAGLRHYRATGESVVLGRRIEIEARHRDGREIPVELTIWALGEGPQVRFNALLHDVSERRRQTEHLELALSAGAMGTWEWDLLTGTVRWSPSLEALHGLTPGTFAGTFEAFEADMHPEDRPAVVEAVRAVLDDPARCDYATEYRILRPDGSVRWVSASGQVLRDHDGRPVLMLGVCGDITERRRLLESERAARLDAEEATRHLERLHRVTAALSRVVTVDAAAEVILGLGLDDAGARTGSLCLLVDDHLEITHARGYPEDVIGHWGRFPLASDLPASDAVRTARAVFLRSSEDRVARYPVFAGSPVVDDEAFAMVPMSAEGRTIGCLVLGFPEVRDFDAADEAFLMGLAAECGLALWRCQLYEERERARRASEEARRRLAVLAEASAALGASLDFRETLRRVAAFAVPGVADWCAIYLVDERGIDPVAVAHKEPEKVDFAQEVLRRYPVSRADPVGIGAVIRTGTTQLLQPVAPDVLAAAARDAEHLRLLEQLDLGAAVVVPLVARGEVIGALSFVNERGRALDDETVTLAEELSARAATAIDNARLFEQRSSIARTLQSSLLPPELPDIPGLEVAAGYAAGGAGVDVGGDFYDLFALDADQYLAVIGDVCGRGAEAAAVAGLARHAARSAAISHTSPAAILRHINQVLVRHAGSDDFNIRFCTALVARIRREPDGTVTVRLAVAGHPLPLVRSAAGSVHPVGTPGTVLGISPEITPTDETIVLTAGTALVCFTDGVTERRHGGEFFGDARLMATLAAAQGDAETIARTIEASVHSFSPAPAGDDLAILVLRHPG